jgi:hypothetical protein
VPLQRSRLLAASGLRRRGLLLAALGALAAALASPPAAAWGPQSQAAIAREAARLAPPDLARQLERRADELRAGALAPFTGTAPERHYRNRESGSLDRAILEETRAAIAALRTPGSFDEFARRLGVVAHYVADANNPLNAAGDDPEEGRYFADYLRYAQSAEPRFALVFYAGEPAVESEEDLRRMVLRALARGRQVYPLVGREYRRIGYGSGVAGFDDRSTAFGVAAVGFSHAISDVARAFRYIWLQGGGADQRQGLWATSEKLVVLPRSAGR